MSCGPITIGESSASGSQTIRPALMYSRGA